MAAGLVIVMLSSLVRARSTNMSLEALLLSWIALYVR